MAENGRHKRDALLLMALARGDTIRDAAKAAGLGERTVYRRLEDEDFRRSVNEARAEMVARAVAMLADASADAVITLRGLLAAESESVKLGAARSILELGNKLRESAELEARIVALEDLLAGRGDVPPVRKVG